MKRGLRLGAALALGLALLGSPLAALAIAGVLAVLERIERRP